MLLRPKEVEELIEGLPYPDKVRILKNVIWEVFGNNDEADVRYGEPIVDTERPAPILNGAGWDAESHVRVSNFVEGLRQELWPEKRREPWETQQS